MMFNLRNVFECLGSFAIKIKWHYLVVLCLVNVLPLTAVPDDGVSDDLPSLSSVLKKGYQGGEVINLYEGVKTLERRIMVPVGRNEKESGYLNLIKVSPEKVIIGEELSFTYLIQNKSSYSLKDVVLNVDMQGGFQFIKSDPLLKSQEGVRFNWLIPFMRPGQDVSVHVTGTPLDKGLIESKSWLDYSTILENQIKVLYPEIDVTLQFLSKPSVCDPIAVNLKVENIGKAPVHNISAKVNLSEHISSNSILSYNIPLLEIGEKRVYPFSINVQKPGVFEIKAFAAADKDAYSESVANLEVVEPMFEIQSKALIKSIINRPASIGISVENNGTGDCEDAVLSVITPKDVIMSGSSETGFIDLSNTTNSDSNYYLYNLGFVAKGENLIKDFKVVGLKAGSSQIQLLVAGQCAELQRSLIQLDVKGVPAINVSVKDINDPLLIDETGDYEIAVNNRGTAADNNLTLHINLDDKMTLKEIDGPGEKVVRDNTIIFSNIPKLYEDDTLIWKIKTVARSKGDARLDVKLTSDHLAEGISVVESTTHY